MGECDPDTTEPAGREDRVKLKHFIKLHLH